MAARFLASLRSAPRGIASYGWQTIRRRAVLLMCCAGLGITASLAPFGIARMRRNPEASPDHAGVLGRTGGPEENRTPEEAAASMLQARFQALVDGDTDRLKSNYDTKSDTGLWSWEKETSRARYLREWAAARGVEVIGAKARIEVDSVTPESSDAVWVEITEHASYVYRSKQMHDSAPSGEGTHTFGSRAVHVLELVLDGGDWRIRRDWYADPIGQESYLPPCKFEAEAVSESGAKSGSESGSESGSQPGSQPVPQIGVQPGSQIGVQPSGVPDPEANEPEAILKYDRKAARKYAIAYAGVPVMEGSGKYNSHFRVYTFVGGDCANFASQVLEAGGLEQGYGWHYTSEGSASWVRGEDLVWHLLSTGRAKRVYSGAFAGAVKRTVEYPGGVISTLEPGDLIAYERKGQISHVAVVVGKDPMGYITIASHTSDRLFFPWDMGWNDATVFWLMKITY